MMTTFRPSRGFTLVETLIVLVVSVTALTLASQYMGYYTDTMVNQSAAEQQKKVADATAAYIKDNYAAVLGVATPSSPAIITTTMLKSTGYLSNAFSDTNAYGQTYSIRVLEPSPNKLETLIITLGGDTVSDINLKRAAQLVGASGGYVSYADTSNANGSYGGWKLPLANYGVSPGAGHLATAVMFADAALLSDYLYRNAVAGHPEFNRMNAALDMAGNNINNGGTINGVTVNATSDVNAGQNVNASVYVNAGADVIAGRDTSAGRNAVATNDVTAGRNVTAANDVIATSNVSAGRYVAAGIDVSAGVNVNAGNNVQALNNVHAQNTVRAEGRVSAGEYLHVAGWGAEGGGCSPEGLIAQGGDGLLVCSGSRWKSVGGKPYVTRGYTSTGYPDTNGHSGCAWLVAPDAYQYYSGGRNDPDGRMLWTDRASSEGYYILVCTD